MSAITIHYSRTGVAASWDETTISEIADTHAEFPDAVNEEITNWFPQHIEDDFDMTVWDETICSFIFQMMNDYDTNPMSYGVSPANQNWIRETGIHTSMSCGDIIQIHDRYYKCAAFGWDTME